MKKLAVALALSGALLLPAAAKADGGVEAFLTPAPPGPPESGLSIGLSVGYGIPMGTASGASDANAARSFSDVYSGAVPLQVDLGWRFSPNIYLGGFFEYAFAFIASAENCNNGVTCSGGDMQFGIDFVYTFAPRATFAPYVGVGLGYEIASLSGSANGQSLTFTYSGFEFARIIVGGDFRLGSSFRLGPFVNFSLAEFSNFSTSGTSSSSVSIPSKALHEWLQFGIKGTVDL